MLWQDFAFRNEADIDRPAAKQRCMAYLQFDLSRAVRGCCPRPAPRTERRSAPRGLGLRQHATVCHGAGAAVPGFLAVRRAQRANPERRGLSGARSRDRAATDFARRSRGSCARFAIAAPRRPIADSPPDRWPLECDRVRRSWAEVRTRRHAPRRARSADDLAAWMCALLGDLHPGALGGSARAPAPRARRSWRRRLRCRRVAAC